MKTLSAKVLNKSNQPERLKNKISGRLKDGVNSDIEKLKKLDSEIEFSEK